jgi:glutamate-5-semialdehyde dehydrogenase
MISAMSIAEHHDLKQYCLAVAERAKAAASKLAQVAGANKNAWLRHSAEQIRARAAEIQEANRRDLKAAPGFGLTDAQTDRLRLTTDRIDAIARGLEEVAMLPDPVGEVIESSRRPNGLEIAKVRVPLGVVFFIYESRPNVTADAAAICVKSGNAVILRGGKEAAHSKPGDCRDPRRSRRLGRHCRPMRCSWCRRPIGRRSGTSCALDEYIDVAIPRGGEGLIRRVTAEARMPVIKHFAGNCHVYVDAAADLDMAERDHGELQVPAAGGLQRGRVAARARRRGGGVSAERGPGTGGARHRDSRRREDLS